MRAALAPRKPLCRLDIDTAIGGSVSTVLHPPGRRFDCRASVTRCVSNQRY